MTESNKESNKESNNESNKNPPPTLEADIEQPASQPADDSHDPKVQQLIQTLPGEHYWRRQQGTLRGYLIDGKYHDGRYGQLYAAASVCLKTMKTLKALQISCIIARFKVLPIYKSVISKSVISKRIQPCLRLSQLSNKYLPSQKNKTAY